VRELVSFDNSNPVTAIFAKYHTYDLSVVHDLGFDFSEIESHCIFVDKVILAGKLGAKKLKGSR
jgi:hypothetical protein